MAKAKSSSKSKPAAKLKAKSAKAKAKSPKLALVPKTRSSLKNLLSPLDDRILVIVEGASDVTAGGIIIPGTATAEKPNRGEVVAKGPGRRSKKGSVRPLDVQVGDQVLFPQYAGTKITIEEQECLILREEDLLGIVT